MRSADVISALRRRYSIDEGEWLFWTEAWRIDAYVVRCWGSPKYLRVAHEVKVSRSDFLSELRKPEKRANALDVSHEFFFVTPKGLVDAAEVPDECGLIYVLPSGTTKVVKKAPRRTPRPFTLAEAVYLMRTPLYRDGILAMRKMMRAAESHTEWLSERLDGLHADMETARARLVSYAGHLVVKGSMWQGRWQPRSWLPAEENVVCYVEEVRESDREEYAYVTLRRLDSLDSWRLLRRADVLAGFVPLDGHAPVC